MLWYHAHVHLQTRHRNGGAVRRLSSPGRFGPNSAYVASHLAGATRTSGGIEWRVTRSHHGYSAGSVSQLASHLRRIGAMCCRDAWTDDRIAGGCVGILWYTSAMRRQSALHLTMVLTQRVCRCTQNANG